MRTLWKTKDERTTPPPRVNVLQYVPELASLAATTVRLHPRNGDVPGPADSKLAGTFLWPADEPWPTCYEAGPPDWWTDSVVGTPPRWHGPEGAHGPLVPVLQLRASDVPEMPFFPGCDLFQLLWCPLEHSAPPCPKPFVFWRDSDEVRDPLRAVPRPVHFERRYLPRPCRLLPERVTEYPDIEDLPASIIEKIKVCDFDELLTTRMEDARDLYNWELSVCRATKVHGHVAWLQSRNVPVCMCGREMEHLLTLAASEYDTGNHRRWCPEEDREVWGLTERSRETKRRASRDAANLDGLAGNLLLFICRNCDGWPVKSVYQR